MTRVLVIGDDIAVARLTQRALEQRQVESEVTVSVHDALFRLESQAFDIVVVDRAEDGAVLADRLLEAAIALDQRVQVLAPTSAAFHTLRPQTLSGRVQELVDVLLFALAGRCRAAA
jgi:CheY-like chemotaxis protein